MTEDVPSEHVSDLRGNGIEVSRTEMIDGLTSCYTELASHNPNNSLHKELIGRLEDVLIGLLGEPSSKGDDEWRWGSNGSLSVNIGRKRGQWFSHEDDVGGGIIALLAREWEQNTALDQNEINRRARALLNKLPKDCSGASLALADGERADKWTAAEAIEEFWNQADSLSNKHGKIYLQSRGIDPEKTAHSVARETQHKANKKSGTKGFPAIVFPLTDVEGKIVGVHAVRCPQGKRLDHAAKITSGRLKGAAIIIPGDRTADGEIIIVEGPEDALSLNQETGTETWAVCSVGNLSAAPLRRGQRIVVIGDADSKTEDKTRAACATLAERCAGVRLAFPRGDHKDANDILMADPERAAEILTELIAQAEKIEAPSTAGSADFDFIPFGVDGTFDPSTIPERAWQVTGLTMLGHMTLIVSPGAVGKSSFGIAAGVAVALGGNDMIPGHHDVEQGNVLLINGEDDHHELNRRLAGVLREYEISPGQLAGKLFLQSFYGQSPRLATYDKREDTIHHGALVYKTKAFCLEHNIKLIIIDPLIGFHNAPENTNEAMEQVAAILRFLAKETGAALIVMHHTRKTGSNSEAHAGDAESGRGAVALIWASRIAKTLARMSKDTARKMNLDWSIGLDLRRIDDAKANYARAAEGASWFRMKSTQIANGETVPVPVAFDMSGLAKELEADKEENRRKVMDEQLSEVGQVLVNGSKNGSGGQTDIGAQLETLLGVGRSTALSRLKALPEDEINAHRFYELGHRYKIWRANRGTDKAPRYTVHWGPTSQAPKSQAEQDAER